MARFNEKYFNIGNDMSANKVEDILDNSETILLRIKPKKSAYIWSSVLEMMPVALIWAALMVFSIVFVCKMLGDIQLESYAVALIVLAYAFMFIPVWMWLYKIITSVLKYKNIEYVFTEKRIIIRSGLIGIDFKSVYYSDIEGVNLNVRFLDRLLKVGDIYIKAKTQVCFLLDIQEPYKLLSEIQKITLDIKTDIFYPNDLRPEKNHGFNIKYSGNAVEEQTNTDSETDKNKKEL